MIFLNFYFDQFYAHLMDTFFLYFTDVFFMTLMTSRLMNKNGSIAWDAN